MAPERRVSPEQVPARRIPVLVNELAIEDGQTPPPRVGDIGRFPLVFAEARDDQPDTDATVSTFRARAEPGNTGEPLEPGKHMDGTPRDRPPVWPTVLHGDGWSAHWSAPRPVTGQIEVRGTLVGDLGISSRQWVRGRIIRARVVTETMNASAHDQTRRRTIPGRQQLREVDCAPRWYDDGLVLPPDAPPGKWVAPVPADPYRVETGVLVELDLDDVPVPALRPAIVPAAVAAHGEDVWAADAVLPLVVRLHGARAEPGAVATQVHRYQWAGRILPGEERGRRVWADAEGCWITGPDGVRRADLAGGVELLDDRAVASVDASASSLLVTLASTRPAVTPEAATAAEVGWRLFAPGRDPVAVDLPPDRRVQSVAGDGAGGFVLLVSRHDPARTDPPEWRHNDPAWLAHLDHDGTFTENAAGQELPNSQLTASTPVLAVTPNTPQRRDLRPVQDGLELGTPQSTEVRLHYLLTAAGRVFAVGPTPERRQSEPPERDEDWWPLPGPFTPPASGRYDLLTELDPHTGKPVHTTLTTLPHHLAVDGTGVVWLPGRTCLYTCPTEPGRPARPYDIAALLEQRDETENPTRPPTR